MVARAAALPSAASRGWQSLRCAPGRSAHVSRGTSGRSAEGLGSCIWVARAAVCQSASRGQHRRSRMFHVEHRGHQRGRFARAADGRGDTAPGSPSTLRIDDEVGVRPRSTGSAGGESELGQARPAASGPDRRIRRLAHDQDPAHPHQSGRDLRRHGRFGEAPGRHQLELLPVALRAGRRARPAPRRPRRGPRDPARRRLPQPRPRRRPLLSTKTARASRPAHGQDQSRDPAAGTEVGEVRRARARARPPPPRRSPRRGAMCGSTGPGPEESRGRGLAPGPSGNVSPGTSSPATAARAARGSRGEDDHPAPGLFALGRRVDTRRSRR